MKLLFIIPSLGSGGAERVASTLINEWAIKKDIVIEVIVFNEGVDFYSLHPSVKIHRLGYIGGQSIFRKIISLFRLLFKLRFYIKKNDSNVMLSFIREANIFALLAIIFTKKRIVISERDSPNVKIPFIYRVLRKLLYPRANYIIAQTSDYEKYIISEVNNPNVIVIANPVREMFSRNIPKEKIILNVGRLISEKGQIMLLHAFAKTKNVVDWKLVIVGGGELKEMLKNESRKLNIQDRVELVGVSNHVDDWLSRASIFGFSSISEGFPNALLEAMAAGVPCISFNCVSGPKDIISDGRNGFLVEVGDVDEFAKKIDYLANNEQVRQDFSNNAKRIASNYTIENIAEQYYTVLKSAMDKS